MTRQALWLLGEGIARSPSPAMHNAALRAGGLEGWSYAVRDVSAMELAAALDELRAGRAAGANVTIPHKRAVAAACDELQGDALLTGAVNTVIARDGLLFGDNTDAHGLERALRHDGLWPDEAATVVLLGAGGAASAAVLALSRAHPAAITVVARREAAVGEMARLMGLTARIGELVWAPWDAAAVHAAVDSAPGEVVLVNATPVAAAGLPLDVAALPPDCTVVDLRYRPRPVDLVAAA